MQRLLSSVRRAIDEYAMIQEGDRIAVGVSGGKDSLALLTALAGLRRFYPKHFSLYAVTLDMGFEGMDFSPVAALCDHIGVDYHIVKTDIKQIIFDIRKEKNPCSLCAKMRRGALHDAALSIGCSKVALGHHHDDVIETFFLSLIYEGRVSCFSPVTFLDRRGITLIRPLIYTPEAQVRGIATKLALPVVHNPCPADGNTKREEVKQLLSSLSEGDPELKTRLFTAVQNSGIPGWGDRVMIHRKPVTPQAKDLLCEP